MTDTPKNHKEKLDKKLDEALKDSFPDSDPVSTLQPDRFPPGRPRSQIAFLDYLHHDPISIRQGHYGNVNGV